MDKTVRSLNARQTRVAYFPRWPSAVSVLVVILSAFFALPILAGLIGTLLPAFGYLPAIGEHAIGMASWNELVSYPGFSASVRLTITTGVAATVLALILASGFCAAVHGRMRIRSVEAMLAPLLATPHAAMAIGLAFVLAPSGWLSRLASPWLTNWTVPPDVAIVQDHWGIALVIGLLVKEVPYLLLVILGALNQIPVTEHLRASRALGYGRGVAWIKVIFPQVYPQIRLPIYAVLGYSLSVVDMAVVLAPNNPAPLSVVALRWFTAPDVTRYLPAAAAAALQLALVMIMILLWRLLELTGRSIGFRWLARGGRGLTSEPGLKIISVLVVLLFALGSMALLAMAVWSFAWNWRFPDALPSEWTFGTWIRQSHSITWPLTNTLILGLTTTVIGLALALAWFESDDRYNRRRTATALQIAYLPLLMPQIAFLFGTQVSLVWLDIDGTFFSVAWCQLLFVLPYMTIALADPWRALDPRYARIAASLGAPPFRILVTVKLPILMRSILIACAIGFAVSVAQYLPTLFAGSGRIPTLTTEAMTLASGADRRVVGVFAFLQSVLPLLFYVLALTVPATIHANRRGLTR
jgi:putative thiamine transport system permease protein